MSIATRTALLGAALMQTAMAATDGSIPVAPVKVSPREIQPVETKLPAIFQNKPFRVSGFPGVPYKMPAQYIPINGLLELYGGRDNFGVVVVPDKVELTRLEPVNDGAQAANGYGETGDEVLSEEDAAVVRTTLTSDSTYDWELEYDEPVYAFRLKFWQDDKLVCVDLSFEGRTLRVVGNGRPIAAKNFEYGYDSLLAVIERHYPGTLAQSLRADRPVGYSAWQWVPPTESETLTADKAAQLIASADTVLISTEDAKEGMNRFVTDRNWIQRVAKAVRAVQLAGIHHCFCLGWKSATFIRNGEFLFTLSAIHGHQLRIHSNIASGDYTIDEAQWKAVASILDEQKLATAPGLIAPTDR